MKRQQFLPSCYAGNLTYIKLFHECSTTFLNSNATNFDPVDNAWEIQGYHWLRCFFQCYPLYLKFLTHHPNTSWIHQLKKPRTWQDKKFLNVLLILRMFFSPRGGAEHDPLTAVINSTHVELTFVVLLFAEPRETLLETSRLNTSVWRVSREVSWKGNRQLAPRTFPSD